MPRLSDDPVLDFMVGEAMMHKAADARRKAEKQREAEDNRNPKKVPELAAMLSG